MDQEPGCCEEQGCQAKHCKAIAAVTVTAKDGECCANINVIGGTGGTRGTACDPATDPLIYLEKFDEACGDDVHFTISHGTPSVDLAILEARCLEC